MPHSLVKARCLPPQAGAPWPVLELQLPVEDDSIGWQWMDVEQAQNMYHIRVVQLLRDTTHQWLALIETP